VVLFPSVARDADYTAQFSTSGCGSPEQIERVLETEAKFPLWQYLQELRKEMQGEISSLKTDLHKDIDGLKTDLARQPYKLFGAVVAACGAVAAAGRAIEALGYQVRITPKD